MDQEQNSMKQTEQSTPDRLLEAASEVFAARGFREATVAEICKLAGANVAAVNYHFGSKEQLYANVWKQAMEETMREAPIGGNATESDPPEVRLREFIRSILTRLLPATSNSRSGQLLLQELAQPVEAIHNVCRKSTQPFRDLGYDIVSRLIGPDADDHTIRYCVMSVLHQCLAIGFRGGQKPPIIGEGPFTADEVEHLADHISQFSIGGIRSMRQRPVRANHELALARK